MNSDYEIKEIRLSNVALAGVVSTAVFAATWAMVDVRFALVALAAAAVYVGFELLWSRVPVPALSKNQNRVATFVGALIAVAALTVFFLVDDAGRALKLAAGVTYLAMLTLADELRHRFDESEDDSMWWSRSQTLRLKLQSRSWYVGVRRKHTP